MLYTKLPDNLRDLDYLVIVCGFIRGVLETVRVRADCTLTKDMLKGADTNEIRIALT